MVKILGLDLGTNSVGWAVVEQDNNEYHLLDKGVRIFQEGVKSDKGNEISKAAERTKYRSARRLKYRRKLRKINTLKVLSEYGYCPKLDNKDLDNWRYKKQYPENIEFRNWWKTDEDQNITPYYYRNLAVTKKLDLSSEHDRFILGRAFYHIAQRRGFKSNRLETTKENADGKVKSSINEINEAKGDKTLGQYFYEKYEKGEKIRNTYTSREEHYEDEFKRICEFQELPDKFMAELKRAIFYQRPLKSQKGLIGKCVFEKNKARCSTSHPSFEEYRMLCFVNNIKIQTPLDTKLRSLNKEEREKTIGQFFRIKDHFDFNDIAKELSKKNSFKYIKDNKTKTTPETILFNYDMRTSVSGCPVSARFKKAFKEDFIDENYNINVLEDGSLTKLVQDGWHALSTFDSDKKLKEFAIQKLGLNEEEAKEYLKTNLKQEYSSLSLKAIKKILPYLRNGMIYSHAVFMANLKNIISEDEWKDVSNQKDISEQIKKIISTQNEEKEIIELVNGMIKTCRENGECWSMEAEPYFKKDLNEKIKKYFGEEVFNQLSESKKNLILEEAFNLFKNQMQKNNGMGDFAKVETIDERVKKYISSNFKINTKDLEKVYHPSATEVYKKPEKKEDGKLYLGSPMIASIKNPMAMRTLHQLRKVINELIKGDVIDSETKINIEMSRDLMNANERKAYQNWQRDREKERKRISGEIKEHYIQHNITIEPKEEDILKYRLWEEQNKTCLYTGRPIALYQFLGANPEFDIEHTIPRSLILDNSQANKTLCCKKFNRDVKKNMMPSQLSNHSEILARIEKWQEKIGELDKKIYGAKKASANAVEKEVKDKAIQAFHKLKFEKNYFNDKYKRFETKSDENIGGFKNSQLVDTEIVTKYARMYMNTVFDKVYTVKGNTVADFRQIWGIQNEYSKKDRSNHVHHCIDAITIACISKANYEELAKCYHDWEELELKGVKDKPKFAKPWKTFVEDIKNIENEILVSHHTPDVLPKQTKKALRKRGIIQRNKKGEIKYQQGSGVRGALHQETFYGAIERKKGEEEKQIKYVVRKPLNSLEDNNIKDIVDERIREIVRLGRMEERKLLKEKELLQKKRAKAGDEEEIDIDKEIKTLNEKLNNLYKLKNKNGESIPIKRVRIYANSVTNPIHLKEHRDKSSKSAKPYKENIHVANDSNYMMAIYEGKDRKGKIKRDFEILNNREASIDKTVSNVKYFDKDIELSLKAILKIGTMVILYEKSPDEVWDLEKEDIGKRLYKVVGISTNRVKSGDKYYEFGMVVMRFHKEARPASDLKTLDGIFKIEEPYIAQRKMSHNQFDALVEGIDFKLTPLGEIVKLV